MHDISQVALSEISDAQLADLHLKMSRVEKYLASFIVVDPFVGLGVFHGEISSRQVHETWSNTDE